jgi:hypothetical protein
MVRMSGRLADGPRRGLLPFAVGSLLPMGRAVWTVLIDAQGLTVGWLR